jgi:hypothetical protein
MKKTNPAALYASDNEWGIPSLLPKLQAQHVAPPVMPWGSVGRGQIMRGTWHFYVDDDRFASLLRHPERIAATCPAVACEPNVTVFDQMPRWEMLASVGAKRTAARAFQELGIPVLVDVNVPARYRDLALVGVPKGWAAYCTRGYSARPDDLREEYALALQYCGLQPLLLVVGGGAAIEALCRTLPGTVWVPDHRTQVRLARKAQRLHLVAVA